MPDFGLLDGRGPLTIPVSGTVVRTLTTGSLFGLWGRVTNVVITLGGLSHTYPGDLDFLLVGPDGTNLEFWSDAGAGITISGRTFVIADSGSSPLPQFAAIPSGVTFTPTDYTDATGVETAAYWTGLPPIAINHPGPTGAGTLAGAFAGAWLARSTWQLWVTDDVPYDGGSLGSWQIDLTYRRITKPGDFDGNNVSDFLWQNSDGTPAIWTMSGFTAVSGGAAANPGADWRVKGAGDFDADGHADILWQNLDGTPGIWLMNGLSVLAAGPVGVNPGSAWHIRGAGDFNFDGKADILWQHDDGTPGVWLMDGMTALVAGPVGTNPGTSWQVKGAGDFNSDGKADILWQNADGTPGIWLMNGMSVLAQGPVGTNPGTSWQVKGSGDFNDDGHADILWQASDGTPGIWLMNGMTVLAAGPVGTNPGTAWHVKGSGDYDGDGYSDILFQHDSGLPGIWLMDGMSVITAGPAGSFSPGADWHLIG